LARLDRGNAARLTVPNGIFRVSRVPGDHRRDSAAARFRRGGGAAGKLSATLDNVPALAANSGHALP